VGKEAIVAQAIVLGPPLRPPASLFLLCLDFLSVFRPAMLKFLKMVAFHRVFSFCGVESKRNFVCQALGRKIFFVCCALVDKVLCEPPQGFLPSVLVERVFVKWMCVFCSRLLLMIGLC